VYEFYELPGGDSGSAAATVGVLYVAQPPPGLPLSALLAQVLSRALGCPFTLPLHPLLEAPDAASLAQLQPMLHPGEAAPRTAAGDGGARLRRCTPQPQRMHTTHHLGALGRRHRCRLAHAHMSNSLHALPPPPKNTHTHRRVR
jgi:hypothetical protein